MNLTLPRALGGLFPPSEMAPSGAVSPGALFIFLVIHEFTRFASTINTEFDIMFFNALFSSINSWTDAQFAKAFSFLIKVPIFFCHRPSKVEENQPVEISFVSKLLLKRETGPL